MRLWIGTFIIAGFSAITQAGGEGHSRRNLDRLRRGPGVSNHPVNIVPSSSINIPEGWPLGKDGAITCFTCHAALSDFDDARDIRLRDFDDNIAEAGDFCASCHNEQSNQNAAAMHWSAIRKAHIKSDSSRGFGAGGSLDGESRRCLGCHDGVNASESKNATPWSGGGGRHGVRTDNHTVGVRYPMAGSRGAAQSLRPAGMLPEQVRLPDGKISCVSCHDLYSRERAFLTVPLDDSQLCFTCHAMD